MSVSMSVPAKLFETLRPELDPGATLGASYDQRRLAAALRKTGLELEDLDPETACQITAIHAKVPKERIEDITQQRQEVRDGLRASRIKKVEECLKKMSDDDVRRMNNITEVVGGVRPIRSDDIPGVEGLKGMDKIQEQQAKQMAKVEADQRRKAKMICTDFLTNKKRADDCDAKIAAQEQRMRDYKRAQRDMHNAKKKEADKASERRQALVQGEMNRRENYQNSLDEKLTDKLNKARSTRAFHYSKENMADKMEKAAQKREEAFQEACAKEEDMLNRMEERRIFVENKLAENREQRRQYLENKRLEGEARFQEKQLEVFEQKQEWIKGKLQFHKESTQKMADSRKRGKDFMKDRSKTSSGNHKNALAKWEANHTRIMNEKGHSDEALMAKHEASRRYCEEELGPMRMKCGEDVHSFREVKHKTYGDLQQRRWAELNKERDAYYQGILFKCAEADAKKAADDAGKREVFRKRQEASKNLLAYKTHADEVFLKIKSEPDEMKIRTAMQGLGFEMPALPKKEGEGEEGQA